MKSFILSCLLLSSIQVLGSDTTSRISFINVTKNDNLIILCKIISHSVVDLTKGFCPEKMVVEVIEVLKGRDSAKLLTVIGQDEAVNSDLACLQFYSIGKYYVLGLDDYKLTAAGNHSLEYVEGTVKGNITNEQSNESAKKFRDLYERIQNEQTKKTPDKRKIETLRRQFEIQSNLLNQSMDYKVFKAAYFVNR